MRSSFLLVTLFAGLLANAQLNVSYVGDITYNQELSDIWGYVAPNGDEYAIVGLYNGVSVVSLVDPSNPTELFFFPGAGSTWRDIKTYDGYAYVTNETGNGLAVIDLTGLPGEASAYDWAPNIPGQGTLSSIHNIWIDEFGYAYLAGSNLNNGGMLYVDVATTPGQPIYVDAGPAIYSHDVFTRNNIMYSSEIYEGVFTIYDVSNKSNSTVLGSSPTEGAFTHNGWLSDDNTILYTTDEVPNAPVGAYDVSDPTDVQELDQYRPYETLGDGVIPHNVHVWQDWLIISYYTDGCIIVDGSNPTNLVEVGNFDTFIPTSTGFSGAWGAYPFLPSGLILISDIGNGMFVLQPNYVNACWLEGVITDAVTSNGLTGADITILNTNVFDVSEAGGEYATGYAIAGSYDILVERTGYISQTVTVDLVNGVVTELDVALQPLQTFAIDGVVADLAQGVGVAGIQVHITGDGVDVMGTTDVNGEVTLDGFFAGDYTVTVGAWGYITQCQDITVTSGDESFELSLSPGYFDDFSLDFGWQSSGNAPTGQWERAIPVGTELGNQLANPDEDVDDDCSGYAYVTGNGGPPVGNDDVDDGEVILTSPVFGYTPGQSTTLSYARWFVNGGGNGTPNDELIVELTDGTTTWEIEEVSASSASWQEVVFDLDALLGDAQGAYNVVFRTSDGANSGHVVEAGVDLFLVQGIASGLDELDESAFSLSVSPNPSTHHFVLDLEDEKLDSDVSISVVDAMGRVVFNSLVMGQTRFEIGADWEAGVYTAFLMDNTRTAKSIRLIKH